MEINNERKLRLGFGLATVLIIAAVCLHGWRGSRSPLHSLGEAKSATHAEAASLPASYSIPWNKTNPEVSKLAAQYSSAVASLPALDHIGDGVFTEEQKRDYFKHYTGLDVPPIATDMTGTYSHRHNRLGISGHQKLYLTLPPSEARALCDIVSEKWKEEHPTDEDGFGFDQGTLPYPLEFKDGDHFPSGTLMVSYSSYEREPSKRVYLLLNPSSGRIRLWWHYGDQ